MRGDSSLMKIQKFLSKSYLGMMAVLRAQMHRENDFTHIVLAMRRADRMRFLAYHRTSGTTAFAKRLRGAKSVHFLSQDNLRVTFSPGGKSRIRMWRQTWTRWARRSGSYHRRMRFWRKRCGQIPSCVAQKTIANLYAHRRHQEREMLTQCQQHPNARG